MPRAKSLIVEINIESGAKKFVQAARLKRKMQDRPQANSAK